MMKITEKISIFVSLLPLFLSSNLLCMKKYLFASGDYNGDIKIWQKVREGKPKINETESWKCIETINATNRPKSVSSSNQISALHASSCGKLLFVGFYDRDITIWANQGGKWQYVQTLDTTNIVECLQFVGANSLCSSPNGRYLFAGNFKGIRIWQKIRNQHKWKCVQTVDSKSFTTSLFCNDRYIFSGNQKGFIKVWKFAPQERWKCIQTLDATSKFMKGIKSLHVTSCGSYLFSQTRAGIVKIWKQNKHKQWKSIKTIDSVENGFIRALYLSQCNKYFFCVFENKTIEKWSLKNDKIGPFQKAYVEKKVHGNPMSCISPCNQYLFAKGPGLEVNILKKVYAPLEKADENRGYIKSFFSFIGSSITSCLFQKNNREENIDKWKCVQTLKGNHIANCLCLIKQKNNNKEERLKFLRKRSNIFQATNLWTETK